MAEFIDYARQKNPGKLNFGTPGVGSLGHLIGETFKYSAKVNMIHVPYRGAGPALNVQAGKLRALAVASDKRVAALPDVPTFTETGHPLVNDPSWFGLIGPARLPDETMKRLYAALTAALKHPEVQKRLADSASIPVGNSPEAFRKVVREANLKFE